MKTLLAQLCGISVICGLALLLAPDTTVRKALSLCCALMLAVPILRAFQLFDEASYSLELARYRELEREILMTAEDKSSRLEKQAVKEEYVSYIERAAATFGLSEIQADISLRWDSDGFWVPEKVNITGSLTGEEKKLLQDYLLSELGLAESRQEYIDDGSQ